MSLRVLKKVSNFSACEMAAPEKEPPRFESFPPEIRNMIYNCLFAPAESCKDLKNCHPVRFRRLQHHRAYVFDTAILRSNRFIGQEAKSVLYGNNIFVQISGNILVIVHLMVNHIPQKVTFNAVPGDAPLPSCIVRVQHRYTNAYSTAAGTSIIIAAANFPVISSLLLRLDMCLPRRSYLTVSLPQIAYSVDKLRKLIWDPIKALEKRCSAGPGEKAYRRLRPVDCTGIFEEAAAMSDRDFESDSDESDSDDCSYDTDTSGEIDSDEEDSDGEDSDEEDSDEEYSDDTDEEESSEEFSNDEEKDETDKGENKSDEATSMGHYNTNSGQKMPPSAASTSGHDRYADTHIVARDNLIAKGRSGDGLGLKEPGDEESSGEITDRGDAEGH